MISTDSVDYACVQEDLIQCSWVHNIPPELCSRRLLSLLRPLWSPVRPGPGRTVEAFLGRSSPPGARTSSAAASPLPPPSPLLPSAAHLSPIPFPAGFPLPLSSHLDQKDFIIPPSLFSLVSVSHSLITPALTHIPAAALCPPPLSLDPLLSQDLISSSVSLTL